MCGKCASLHLTWFLLHPIPNLGFEWPGMLGVTAKQHITHYYLSKHLEEPPLVAALLQGYGNFWLTWLALVTTAAITTPPATSCGPIPSTADSGLSPCISCNNTFKQNIYYCTMTKVLPCTQFEVFDMQALHGSLRVPSGSSVACTSLPTEKFSF